MDKPTEATHWQLQLPLAFSPEDHILPGVRYGRPDELLSPAYWAMRCTSFDASKTDSLSRHITLAEEVGFCLLGGFGVTMELATAFFERLKSEGAFECTAPLQEEALLRLLLEPASVDGRPSRYRFPRQRASRISKAMNSLKSIDIGVDDPVVLRDQLQAIDGIGPKTASWIARNWLGTDHVAILDIHVLRAGWAINLFDKNCRLPRDYFALERQFIMFAELLHVRASVLDAVIWSDMRKFGSRLVKSSGIA